jgi:hypothetical protein
MIVAGFVIDGWWGIAMVATVLAAAVLMTRAFGIGSERAQTRAVVPQVGLRVWRRAGEPTGLPSNEGVDR